MKNKADEKIKLTANIRNLLGKKAKKLRKQGLILGNIYGTDFKSQSITINAKDFLKTYKIAKETGIVYLEVDKKELPVLIKNIQKHPITDQIIHVDFRKIDLKKKIETEVPIKIVGVSEAVSQKDGVLLTQTNSIIVEALPEDIPQEIKVDISVLKEIGQDIKVSQLPKSEKYEIKSPADKVLVSVVAHKEESITPETTTTKPEVITKTKAEESETKQQETPSPAEKKEEKTESNKKQ
ncbi:MAG: 50S ribosomal protein L25 [Patescibacteria group bacterium]|nr:50S ribosomal protein L25 [Patescibacteria group bacterium]